MQSLDYAPDTSSPASGVGRMMSTRPASILIVEDERIVALDLRYALEELGYRVTGTAASAAEAHAAVSLERPDLVLMDVRLDGDVDGIQTAEALRTELQVPVVFLTANANSDVLRRALLTVPGGFLAKPYDRRTLVSTIEVALSQHQLEVELRSQSSSLERESFIDALTGLYNRRYLERALARELQLAEREHHSVGAIMLDLDHFKAVNDSFGHVAGDAVLRGVADVLRARLRVYDVACRYGGEELIVVVPGATLFGTWKIAEDLREAVASRVFTDGARSLGTVTASFGVAVFPEQADGAAELIQACDAEMYRAKAQGRNCVVARGQ
jgi:diguanylate cyclase (GGDEF)-like protein